MVASRSQEAHLKDGELKFGLDEDEMDKRPERNPDLEEGKPLKDEYGQPPAYYMGLPLEEIDKGIKDKVLTITFNQSISKEDKQREWEDWQGWMCVLCNVTNGPLSS